MQTGNTESAKPVPEEPDAEPVEKPAASVHQADPMEQELELLLEEFDSELPDTSSKLTPAGVVVPTQPSEPAAPNEAASVEGARVETPKESSAAGAVETPNESAAGAVETPNESAAGAVETPKESAQGDAEGVSSRCPRGDAQGVSSRCPRGDAQESAAPSVETPKESAAPVETPTESAALKPEIKVKQEPGTDLEDSAPPVKAKAKKNREEETEQERHSREAHNSYMRYYRSIRCLSVFPLSS